MMPQGPQTLQPPELAKSTFVGAKPKKATSKNPKKGGKK